VAATLTDWRQARLDAIDAVIAAITVGLEHLDDLEQLLEADGNGKALTAVRTTAAVLRSTRSDYGDQVAQLRAVLADRK
jgi:hypothetical protein